MMHSSSICRQKLVKHLTVLTTAICIWLHSYPGYTDEASKHLKIITPNLPPFISHELLPDEPFVIMIKEIFEPLGYTLTLEYTPLTRAIIRMKQETLSVRFPAWQSEGLAKFLSFSDPVLQSKWSYFSRKNLDIDYSNPNPDKRYILGGATSGTPSTDLLLPKILKRVPGAERHRDIVEQLLRGRIDVWMIETNSGKYMLEHYHPEVADQYHVSGHFQDADFGLVINQKNEYSDMIIADFNKGLTRLKESGRYGILMKQAFDQVPN